LKIFKTNDLTSEEKEIFAGLFFKNILAMKQWGNETING